MREGLFLSKPKISNHSKKAHLTQYHPLNSQQLFIVIEKLQLF